MILTSYRRDQGREEKTEFIVEVDETRKLLSIRLQF